MTAKPTLVEKMARAFICAKLAPGVNPDELVPEPGTGQGDLRMWEQWRTIALALDLGVRIPAALAVVLAEMREPSEGMVKLGGDARGGVWADPNTRGTWRAMFAQFERDNT